MGWRGAPLVYDLGGREGDGHGSLTHRLRLSLPTHGVERSTLSFTTLEVERVSGVEGSQSSLAYSAITLV
jgi:hypothetical protein